MIRRGPLMAFEFGYQLASNWPRKKARANNAISFNNMMLTMMTLVDRSNDSVLDESITIVVVFIVSQKEYSTKNLSILVFAPFDLRKHWSRNRRRMTTCLLFLNGDCYSRTGQFFWGGPSRSFLERKIWIESSLFWHRAYGMNHPS